MAAKEIAVKKYVVKLTAEERERLDTLIRSGKHSAQKLTKARILLKADASEAGEAWSDSRIASALDTSLATVARTRQQLVEEGFDAVLTRKHSPSSARPRIFDGAKEAKLIALACSEPPKGHARWTLRLLEDQVVELNIVGRASGNTIGRDGLDVLFHFFVNDHLLGNPRSLRNDCLLVCLSHLHRLLSKGVPVHLRGAGHRPAFDGNGFAAGGVP